MDDEIQQIYEGERMALIYARMGITRYAPFSKLPSVVTGRLIDDYKRYLEKGGASRDEAEYMMTNDLRLTIEALRTMVIPLGNLGNVRHGVLLHVGLIIGMDALKSQKALWEALRAEDYEAAHDELLSSTWPRLVGITDQDRKRVLDLARQLRTGQLPPDWLPHVKDTVQ